MSEKHFNISAVPDDTRIRQKLYPSHLFPVGSKIRAGDLELEVVSTNDKKDGISLKLVGVFLQPKDDASRN